MSTFTGGEIDTFLQVSMLAFHTTVIMQFIDRIFYNRMAVNLAIVVVGKKKKAKPGMTTLSADTLCDRKARSLHQQKTPQL